MEGEGEDLCVSLQWKNVLLSFGALVGLLFRERPLRLKAAAEGRRHLAEGESGRWRGGEREGGSRGAGPGCLHGTGGISRPCSPPTPTRVSSSQSLLAHWAGGGSAWALGMLGEARGKEQGLGAPSPGASAENAACPNSKAFVSPLQESLLRQKAARTRPAKRWEKRRGNPAKKAAWVGFNPAPVRACRVLTPMAVQPPPGLWEGGGERFRVD